MASDQSLRIFPTMSSLRKKAPVRKGSTKYTTKPPSGLPEFEMLAPPGKSNGIIIQITEGHPSTIELTGPDTEVHTVASLKHLKPQPPPLTIPPKAHITPEQRPSTPPSPLTPSPVQDRAPSAADVPLPRSSAPTPALVEDSNYAMTSPVAATPVMRSMFPRYDPERPLARQSYYPNVEAVPGLASAMAVAGSSHINRTSNNPYRQQMVRRSLDHRASSFESQRKVYTEIKESPLRTMESNAQIVYSSPTDLDEIWGIANGQAASNEAAGTYSLELSW